MKNYKEKFQSIEKFEELFDLREELLSDEEIFSSVEKSEPNFDNIKKCQNINFWLEIVNARIKSLIRDGEYLDKIEKCQPAT